MPSSIAGPSKATNVRPRIDKRGRRTAAGLRGCDTQYNSISFIAANVRSAGWYLFKIVVPFLIIIILNVHRLGSGCVRGDRFGAEVARIKAYYEPRISAATQAGDTKLTNELHELEKREFYQAVGRKILGK